MDPEPQDSAPAEDKKDNPEHINLKVCHLPDTNMSREAISNRVGR